MKRNRNSVRWLLVILLIAAVAVLCACEKNGKDSGDVTNTPNSEQQNTVTTAPISNPQDSVTPTPEPTASPTNTPKPTATPTPTEIPVTPTPNPLDDLTIKDFYKDDFKVGVALPGGLIANPAYSDEVLANFSSMTFENECKPDALLDLTACRSGLPETYTEPKLKFNSIDSGLKYAQMNGLSVRFHTLLWHEQTPKSFFTEDYTQNGALVSREVMLQRMESYIRQVMEYLDANYPGLVYCYDVVNEAIDPGQGDPDGMRVQSMWYQVVGPDFMNYAFEYARKYAPKGVDLYYNDYNCYSKKSQIIKILTPILQAGNIDGIGMQSHLNTHSSIAREVRGTAEEFTKAGFKVQLTELDIGTTDTANGELAQAMKYKVLFKEMRDAKQKGTVNIDCITIWGLHDGVSWRRDEYPLIYRLKGVKLEKKKAWYGILQDPEIPAMDL